MSIASFQHLLELIRVDITKENVNFRPSISAEEKLLVTLRYLATGQSFASLHYSFRLGKSTIAYIIRDTCKAIWKRVAPIYMAPPDQSTWQRIADGFWDIAYFPNCLGAIDGKHVRIIMPPKSGSRYYNYKRYFSLVILAIADVNSNFIYIDVGSYGSSCDSFIFHHSNFYQRMEAGLLGFPPPKPWPRRAEPAYQYTLVGDEAFGLGPHMMRPYPSRGLNDVTTIFNKRLTRARRVVECAFGILVSKWRILHTPIQLDLPNAVAVIKAACCLHNFVRQREGGRPDDPQVCAMQDVTANPPRGTSDALNMRNSMAQYFVSPDGYVAWQDE
ncbi:uncharacterized protein [Hyperolius riggenbachi]|uniref:uncharacterized protein n=1 Tax=Hyperolius riggenbachi TaxID=752182 RepID=UPI0035A2FBFD